MACTVAPRYESKSEAARPAKVTMGKSDQLSANKAASSAMMTEPKREANIPNNETPPEVPFSTRFWRSVMIRGRVGFRTPNSVAHVSALTAASDAANPTQLRVDSG